MTAIPNDKKLTAEEYQRITAGMQERTELIDGQIVALAQPSRLHQRIAYRMYNAIDTFIRANHGQCEVNGEIEVLLDDANTVVPDVSVTCAPSKLDDRGCKGAPDWVVEILSTNRNDDLVYKLDLYLKSGVREYWIIDPKYQKAFVYYFEQSQNVVKLYDWSDEIPVNIYGGKLTIRIEDLV